MKKFPSLAALVAAALLTVASGNSWSEYESPAGSAAPATQTPPPASGAVPGWYPPASHRGGYARPRQQRPYRPAQRRGYGERPRYYSPREQYRAAPAAPATAPAAAENPLSAELERIQEQLAAKNRELDIAHAMLEQLRGKLEESLAIERTLTEKMTRNTRERQVHTSELSAALNTASATMERNQQQIIDGQAQNQELAAERDRLRDELASRNEELAALNLELQDATQALEQAQAGASSTGEELDAARAQIETRDNELTALRADLAKQQTELQNLVQTRTEERDQLRTELAGRDEQLAELQAQAEDDTTDEELDTARAQIETLDNELSEVNAELETWKTTSQETDASLAAVKDEREGLQTNLDDCNQELAQARAALTDLQTEMDALDLERLVVIETASPPAAGGTEAAETVALQGVTADADGDGIPASRDLCPGTPPGTAVDSTGCATGAAISLEGVNFLYDSHELTADAQRILDRVATVINQHPDLRLQVAGHTDATGDPSYNQWLSMQRAEAVMDYLVAQGVKRAHIGAVGYGGQRPVADNDTLEGLKKNRRVELRRLQ
ncbi:MAG: OmpA family protein [Gammaproteobacteria bacterium]|nr:OmpA family protein [Gammaproteobacteria bacterium]